MQRVRRIIAENTMSETVIPVLALTSALYTGVLVTRLIRKRLMSFNGKVVLITGGSRGLGLALAREFAAEGARLVLVARDHAELDRAAADLRKRGAEVLTIDGDLRQAGCAEAVINTTMGKFGRLDVLINNAGIITVGPLENMTLDDFENNLDTHVRAPLRMMMAAVPHLKHSRGRIVNISSIGGKIAVPHLAPYTASKFGLTGLSDAFRTELRKDGVKVTSVFPGLMRTGSHGQALFKGRQSEEFGWFALGSGTPVTSISAARAARQIVRACRAGKPQLIITLQARLAAVANALLPNLSARVFAVADRVLPSAVPDSGEALPGRQCRGSFPPRALTILSDRAGKRYNESN